jgi:GNAT superfamily N-acetyltransferase
MDSPAAFSATYEDAVGRPDDEWILRAQRSSTGEETTTFIALIEHRPVGLVTGYRPPESLDEVELVSMWTSPDVRRSGAGRLLVQALIEWAVASRARLVGLWVMRGNSSAEQFYLSMGFRESVNYEPQPSDPCAEELRLSLTLDQSTGR